MFKEKDHTPSVELTLEMWWIIAGEQSSMILLGEKVFKLRVIDNLSYPQPC